MGLSTLMAEIICLVGRRETLNGRLCECFYKYIKLYNGIILMNEEDTLTMSDPPKTQMKPFQCERSAQTIQWQSTEY